MQPCKDVPIGCVDGQEMANGSDPASGTAGPGSVGQVSVRQGLIELEFGDRLRINVEVRRDQSLRTPDLDPAQKLPIGATYWSYVVDPPKQGTPPEHPKP